MSSAVKDSEGDLIGVTPAKQARKDEYSNNKVDQNVAIESTNEDCSRRESNFSQDQHKSLDESNYCQTSSQMQSSVQEQQIQTPQHSQQAQIQQMQASQPQQAGNQQQNLQQPQSSVQSQVATQQHQVVSQAQSISAPQPSSTPQPFYIQQPLGASPYQLHQLYPHQQMIIQPGNLTIQNMSAFQQNNGSLSLQIPNVAGTMPLPNVTSKQPIVSKGVAISPLAPNIGGPQNQMLPFKNQGSQHLIKHMIPGSPFQSNNAQILISQFTPNQHQPLLPNPTKNGDNKGKFILSQGTAQIQPKSSVHQQGTLASQPVMNPPFKQIAANNLITQTPPVINSSILTLPSNITLAPAGGTSALITQNNSPFIFRSPNQSDQMIIQTSGNMSGTPFYLNQSGVHVVTSNAGPVISVASNQSNTATNTTQSISTSSQNVALGSGAASTPSNKYKPLRPASSVGTQTAVATQTSSFTYSKQNELSNKQSTSKAKSQSSTKSTNSAQTHKTTGVSATTQTIGHQISVPSSNQSQVHIATPQLHTSQTQVVPACLTVQMPQTSQNSVQANTGSTIYPNQFGSQSHGQVTPQSINQSIYPSSSNLNSHSERISSTVTMTLVSQSGTQANLGPTHEKSVKHPSVPRTDAANQTSKSVSVEAKYVQPVNTRGVGTEMNGTKSSKSMPLENSEDKGPKKDKVKKKTVHTDSDIEMVAAVNENLRENNPVSKNMKNTCTNKPAGKLNEINNSVGSKVSGTKLNQPQKAIVKPHSHVLTHVIDGYVIRESPSPFPLNGISNIQLTIDENENENNNEGVKQNPTEDTDSLNNNLKVNKDEENSHISPKTKVENACENCGKNLPKSTRKMKKLKRFCSNACAKFFSANRSRRLDLFNPVTDNSSPTDNNGAEDVSDVGISSIEGKTKVDGENIKNISDMNNSTVNTTSKKSPVCSPVIESNCSSESRMDRETPMEFPVESNEDVYIPAGGTNPLLWSIQDVYDFLRNSGCQEYADDFRSQEIDGQALMLLQDHHLMANMNIKLGPALKIFHKINSLKLKAESSSKPAPVS